MILNCVVVIVVVIIIVIIIIMMMMMMIIIIIIISRGDPKGIRTEPHLSYVPNIDIKGRGEWESDIDLK